MDNEFAFGRNNEFELPLDFEQLVDELSDAALSQDKKRECKILQELGFAYWKIGDFATTVMWFEDALKLARQMGYLEFERDTLGNLGLLYQYWAKNNTKAMNYLQQTVLLTRKIGDKENLGQALGNLAMMYNEIGKKQEAIDLLQKALAIDRQYGMRRGESTRLGNLGSIYRELGETEKAIKFLREALEIDQKIGARDGQLIRVGNLGLVYITLNQPKTAIPYFKQAIEIAREIGQRHREGMYLCEMGCAYLTLNQIQLAERFLREALTISHKIRDITVEAKCAWFLATIYQKEKPLEAAKLMDIVVYFERIIRDPEADEHAAIADRLRKQKPKPKKLSYWDQLWKKQ